MDFPLNVGGWHSLLLLNDVIRSCQNCIPLSSKSVWNTELCTIIKLGSLLNLIKLANLESTATTWSEWT